LANTAARALLTLFWCNFGIEERNMQDSGSEFKGRFRLGVKKRAPIDRTGCGRVRVVGTELALTCLDEAMIENRV
jgi:hypothetical protein